jgi:hypothetical protein
MCRKKLYCNTEAIEKGNQREYWVSSKGRCHEIWLQVFCHESFSPTPWKLTIRIFSKTRRKSRCRWYRWQICNQNPSIVAWMVTILGCVIEFLHHTKQGGWLFVSFFPFPIPICLWVQVSIFKIGDMSVSIISGIVGFLSRLSERILYTCHHAC